MIIKNWLKVPAEFRSKLFWAWNGNLSGDIIAGQIRCLKDMGMGGFYMHSRTGLCTQYLSKEWFDAVDLSIVQARENGLEAALYDEDRWPSGAGGGMVAAGNPELSASCLNLRRGGEVPANLIYSVEIDGIIWYFYREISEKSEWFNGSCYPDVFNPASAEIFLQLTHERYLAHCGSFPEAGIREIFMDEPYYGTETLKNGSGIPWTPEMPGLYRKRFGEDLLPLLPGLFVALPDDSHVKVRWQYYLLLAELFRENFLIPVAGWCEKHHLKLTGHLLGEDTLISQAAHHGSNMAAAACMQQPGIDYLTGQRRHYTTAKQLSSVARQLGKRDRLAEICGCTGWEFPLYSQSAIGDMLFALGVNKNCLHLGWYTAAGEGKRDFPASLAWHASHREEHHRLEDRLGRLHAVFAESDEVRDVLMLNPVESAYTLLEEDFETSFNSDFLENSRVATGDALFNSNIDFDLGDEELIARHGAVNGDNFIVGQAAYRAVVVPETVTLRSTTWELLKKFVLHDGKVFFTGPAPGFIDGLPRQEEFPFEYCELAELSEKLAFLRRVSVKDGDGREVPGLLHLLLRHEKGSFLFIHNPGYTPETLADATNWRGDAIHLRNREVKNVKITLAGSAGTPEIWDPSDGSCRAAPETIDLPVNSSCLLFFADKPRNAAKRDEYHPVAVKGPFKVKLTEPNVLLFDRAELAASHGGFHAPQELRRLDNFLRKRGDLPPRMIPRRQPWADQNEIKRIPVTLRFSCYADVLPQGPVYFACEDPEAEISCNGTLLEPTDYQWFDHSLNFSMVKGLTCGLNHFICRTHIHNLRTLENCFLLGDFGVRIDGFDLHLTEKVETLDFGNWVSQGLPFYSGAVDYRIPAEPGKKRKLDLDILCSYACILEAPDRNWHEKNDLRIPDDSDEVTLRVYGSRRNSHGPFHVVQQLRYCNPASFIPMREEYHPMWQLESYGIFNKKG